MFLCIVQGAEKACAFIRDFILPQLIGEDIDEIYPITNAMEKLAKMLKEQGRGAPEPRLIDQLGQSTLVSCYLVGIYSDQKLLGKGIYYLHNAFGIQFKDCLYGSSEY